MSTVVPDTIASSNVRTALELIRRAQALLETPVERQPEPVAVKPVGALLDKSGIADALGCSTAKIDRLDKLGQPFVRVGDSKRYRLDEVLAWHASRPAKGAK